VISHFYKTLKDEASDCLCVKLTCFCYAWPIICFVYTTWAIGHFYDKTKVSSYLKAFFAYISGMLTYGAAVVLLGNLFDLLRGG
jgi:hypothetical protein